MSHRQAALFGGIAALLLIIAVAATATVIARNGEVPEQQQATTTVAVPGTASSTAPATTTTSTAPATTTPRSGIIGAQKFIVGDLSGGSVLSSRKSTDVWPLASLTKLMTATIALREIAPDEQVLIVPVPGGNPSAPGIPVGQAFAMRDVLAVMLVASSNEAAESLAAHVGREEFLAAMNAQASAWGLDHTRYVDASGLAPGNTSTAREMLAIVQHVYAESPEVFAITRQGSATVYASGTGVAYTAYATHELIRDPGFLGGKTGFTDEARGNLVSVFRVGAGVDAFVVMGSDDRFGDTRRLVANIKNQQ